MTLRQEGYGKTVFRQCVLNVTVFESKGTVEMRCVLNSRPPANELTARRALSDAEVKKLKTNSIAGDLYAGGHTGKVGPSISSGMFETLKVFCCDRQEWVVLVTQGNSSFQKDGPRLRLLGQFHEWLAELKKTAGWPPTNAQRPGN